MYTDQQGMQSFDEPQAMTLGEIAATINDYRQATVNALVAGFDGVELHCTSGYLPAQFLSSGTNARTDEYGGSVVNRTRFAVDVLQAMSGVAGPDRVGVRICPDNPFNDLYDDAPEQTFNYLLQQLQPMGIAYLHAIRFPKGRVDNLALARRYFADRLIGNESYHFEEANREVAAGTLTAVSFGRHFIANPDLVARWQGDLPLSSFDLATLYSPGAEGYTSYPSARTTRISDTQTR
jgi:N-ethylmaleimide reductase